MASCIHFANRALRGVGTPALLWKLLVLSQSLLSIWLVQATQHNPSLTLLAVVVWGGAAICIEDELERLQLRPSWASTFTGFTLLGYTTWRSGRIMDVETVSLILPLLQGVGLGLLVMPIRQLRRWREPLFVLALLPLQTVASRLLPDFWLSTITARLSQTLLLLFGENAVVSGRTVTLGERGVYVAGYCNSVDLIAQLTAIACVFALAFPIRQRLTKLLFICAAPLLAVSVNACRIAILAALNSKGLDYSSKLFTFLHDEWGALVFAGLATTILGRLYLSLINRELRQSHG